MARVRVGAAEVHLALNTAAFQRGAKGVLGTTRIMRRAFIALGGVLSIHGARRMFELGAAVEETGSKFRTVFGSMADDVQGFVDEFANMAGLTDQQAKDFTSNMGAIAQGAGLAGSEVSEFSKDVVKLAGDFSSFHNIPITETLAAIRSSVTAEHEPMKRLGVIITETAVAQRALADTGKENVKQLTQQEKITARLALITEQAGVVIGDLERTQDSAANRARNLGARFRDIRDAVATALLPAFDVFLTAIENSLGGTVTFIEWLKTSGPIMTAWAEVGVAAFSAVATTVKELTMIVIDFGRMMQSTFAALIALAAGDMQTFMTLADEIDAAWVSMGESFVNIGDDMREVLERISTALDTFGETTVTIMRPALDIITNRASAAADQVERLAKAIRALNVVSRALAFIPGAQGAAAAVSFGSQLIRSAVDVREVAGSIFGNAGADLSSLPGITPPADYSSRLGLDTGNITITLDVRDMSGRTTRVLRERLSRLDQLDVPVTV